MSRVPCPIDGCDHPARSGYPCGGCEADLRRALEAVPALVRELDTTLSRQTSRTTAGKASVTPLPYDARASEAMWVLRSALVGWVRVLNEDETAIWPADRPAAMARWLSERLQRLVRHPAAPEAHGEITEAVRGAQRVVDRPAERQFAGRCPGCGEALYGKPGAAAVQCRAEGCDADPVDVAVQWDAMLDQMQDQLVTATMAADILTRLAAPLRADLVRKWAERDRLIAHAHDQHGHPLYRVSDVRDLLVAKLKRDAENEAKRRMKAEKVAS